MKVKAKWYVPYPGYYRNLPWKKQPKFLYPEGVSPLEQSIKCLLGEDGNFCHFHVKTKQKILNRNLSIHVRAAEQLSVRVRNEFIPFLSIVFLFRFFWVTHGQRERESESSLPKKQDETVKRLSRQLVECVPSLSSWIVLGLYAGGVERNHNGGRMDDFSVAERERDSSGSFSFLFGSLAFSFCFSVSNEPKSSGESIQERERERRRTGHLRFIRPRPSRFPFGTLWRHDTTIYSQLFLFSFFLFNGWASS